jgi:hypothetical protein
MSMLISGLDYCAGISNTFARIKLQKFQRYGRGEHVIYADAEVEVFFIYSAGNDRL